MSKRSFLYSFGNVIALLDGVPISGYASGNDAIIITPNTEQVTKVVGADGWVVFNLSEDDTATIQIKLLPTSPSNGFLSFNFERLKATKTIQDSQFFVKDLSTSDTWVAENFVVKGRPESQRGAENGEQTWALECSSLRTTYAGEF